MTTQYTPILQLALPVTGELNGTWGDVVNDNITSMVEEAIAGLATISTWTTNSHTLTTANGTTDEARCAMLVLQTGSGGTALSAAGQVICPAETKLYVVQNNAAYAVTVKTSGGSGIAVAAGDSAFVFCDGTNVNACVTQIINGHITGNLTVDGNATINGNTTLGNATTDTITATARFNTDLLPSADNTYDLGTSGNSWRNLYVDTTGTIATIIGTNLQITNLKSNDGVAAGSIANVTGIVTLNSSVLTSTDINGGTIDNTTIGAATPAAGTFTQVDITAQGDLRLQDASGGQYVAMQAPATVPTSYTLTWPDSDGDAGQALITDGSGVLSWSTSASGDVYGPGSATDNAVTRFDGTTGKLIQNSVVIIDDSGNTSGVGTFTASGDSSFTSTGALQISKGTTGQQPGSAVTGMMRYNTSTNQFEGYSGASPAWKSIGGSALSNDTSTATNLYPVFAAATTGTAENLYTSNAKYLYKPSTGDLQSSQLVASNGLVLNATTLTASYTIASGYSAESVGGTSGFTIPSGMSVTVSSGSRWVII